MAKEKKIKSGGGSICGGIISSSMSLKMMKKYGIWAGVMAYILPDKQYDRYVACIKQGKDKQATKIFERYAHSQID